MANNPVVNSITFTGGVAGQASVQAQGIAGNLTFLLPNTTPITGQLLDVQAVNGNNVFLGWVSAGTETISLSQLLQSGATTNQFISWNGTSWVPTSSVPGEGTVTSVAVTVPAWLAVSGSPITTAGTIAITSAPSLTANWVLATPNGSAGVLAPRALVAADIPSLPYDASGAAAAVAAQLPSTFAAVTHEFLTSYTAGTPGVFVAAQPAFTDLSGSIATGQIPASTITIAQINSKQGNGNAVQLTNTGATVAGDVVTYDANGNTVDSSTLLSSLATTASLSAYALKTGTVFSGNVEIETSLLLDVSLTDNGASTGGSGQVLTAGTGGHVVWSTNISGNAASITGSITSSQVSDLAANTVTSFNSRQGVVSPTSGDYSVGQVTGAAPLASPAFSGTPTAPTATPLTNSTQVATTAYTDLAVGAETSRAEAAEALKASLQGASGDEPSVVSDRHIATGNNATLPGTSGSTDYIAGAVATGTFQVGETVTQSVSGATAVFVQISWQGGLIVNTLTGSPDGTDTWTGGTSTATFTPSTSPIAADSANWGFTVTLSGAAAYSAANAYSVQVTSLSPYTGTGRLWVNGISGTQFFVLSSDGADTSSFFWTCFGKNSAD